MNTPYTNYALKKGWLSVLFQYSVTEESTFNKCIGKVRRETNSSLLDIGFGSGALLAWAQDNGYSISGIELQKDLAAAAEKRGVRVYDSCNEAPPMSQDVITMFDLLEHLDREEINQNLSSAYTALKPGGLIIIRVPNCQSPLGMRLQLADHTHKTMLSAPILENYLSIAGFKHVTASSDHESAKRSNLFKSSIAVVQLCIRRVLYFSVKSIFSLGATPLTPNILVKAKK